MKYLIFGSLLAIFGVNSFAGEKGNGGSVGVCFDKREVVIEIKENGNRISKDHLDRVTSIQALDVYEAENLLDTANAEDKLINAKKDETPGQYVTRVISRFEKTIPELYLVLRKMSETFKPENITYFQNVGIDTIYDTGARYYLDPNKCVIATAIRQTQVDGKPRLEIDNRLFSHPKHSKTSQGILMVHETVLRWAIGIRNLKPVHEETLNTRLLVVTLTLKELTTGVVFKKLSALEFAKAGDDHLENNLIVPKEINSDQEVVFSNSSENYFTYFKKSLNWGIFEKYFTDEFWEQGISYGKWTYSAYVSIQYMMEKCLVEIKDQPCIMNVNSFVPYEAKQQIWRLERFNNETFLPKLHRWEINLADYEEKLKHARGSERKKILEEIESAKEIIVETKAKIEEISSEILGLKAMLEESSKEARIFTEKYAKEIPLYHDAIINDLIVRANIIKIEMQKELWLGAKNIKILNDYVECSKGLWKNNEPVNCSAEYVERMTIAVPVL